MTNKELLKKLRADAKEAHNHMMDASKPARDEGRVLNAEENEAFDKYQKEWTDLEGSIKRLEQSISIENRVNAEKADLVDEPQRKPVSEDPEENKRLYRMAFWKMLFKKGFLTEPEQKAWDAVIKAQSTTDAAGGYTIPQGFSNQLEIAMKWYGPMLEAGHVFDPGSGGNDYKWPTLNDTTNTGKLLAEAGNATTNANDLTFAEITFGAYKFSSDLLAYSAEIQLDSAFNFEQVIAERLAERLGRVQNTYFTTGTGSSQPQGVVVGAGFGNTATGNLATEITRGDLIDLQHTVDKAYRTGPKAGYMMHDSTLAALKKLSFGSSDARPLWVPSMRESEPGTLEGFRYWVNNDMAEASGGAKTILFGDFDKFKIRQAGGVRVKQSDDIYITTDSSAIVAFSRYDSKKLDGGGGAIKYMRMLSS